MFVDEVDKIRSHVGGQANVSGFRAKSDQEGFVVAWPQGVSNSWNGYGCCGTADSQNIDDVNRPPTMTAIGILRACKACMWVASCVLG